MKHLSEAPSETKPKNPAKPSYTMDLRLHERKTHYFQCKDGALPALSASRSVRFPPTPPTIIGLLGCSPARGSYPPPLHLPHGAADYDSMFREQLSRLDHDGNDYVQFKELSKALDEAHQGRWTHGLGPADVTALAATLETTGVSVTVAGTRYSTGTREVTKGTKRRTVHQSDAPDDLRSLPYISLTWTSDNGTKLDFSTKLSDARFKDEFKTKALAAINNGASSAFNGIQGKQSVKSTMWRYIYTVNRYNTEMEFDGIFSTCFFLDRTYGLADCFDFEDRAAGSSPLQYGASPGPRVGGDGNGNTALDYHAAHMYPPEGYTAPPVTTKHNGGFRGQELVGRQPGPDHWC